MKERENRPRCLRTVSIETEDSSPTADMGSQMADVEVPTPARQYSGPSQNEKLLSDRDRVTPSGRPPLPEPSSRARCGPPTTSGVLDSRGQPVPPERVLPAIRLLFEKIPAELHHLSGDEVGPLIKHYGLGAFFPYLASRSEGGSRPGHVKVARERLGVRLRRRLAAEMEDRSREQRAAFVAALRILQGRWQIAEPEKLSAFLDLPSGD